MWIDPFGLSFFNRTYTFGWRIFEFGIIKIKYIPESGARLSPQMYKGFILKFYWWFPISFDV